MKENLDHAIRDVCTLSRIPVCRYNVIEHRFQYYNEIFQSKLIEEHPGLCAAVIENAKSKEEPFIYLEQEVVCIAAIRTANGDYIMLGPVRIGQMSYSVVRHFCRTYGVKENQVDGLSSFEFYYFITAVDMIYNLIWNKKLDFAKILNTADGKEEEWNLDEQKAIKNKEEYDNEQYHHTYSEELHLLNMVENGNVEGAKNAIVNIITSAGRLSRNPLNHYRNLAVCCITIVSRSAMAGGLEPAKAYELSDLYINRLDALWRIQDFNRIMCESVEEYTKLVAQKKEKRLYSNYIEQCKAYIDEKYKEKIALEDIAEYIGVNPTYLSHLFVETEGMTMKEYLTKSRIERAMNLLKYSDISLIEISDYVGFCSQSYFGNLFKKHAGMTPAQYRNRFSVVSRETRNV